MMAALPCCLPTPAQLVAVACSLFALCAAGPFDAAEPLDLEFCGACAEGNIGGQEKQGESNSR